MYSRRKQNIVSRVISIILVVAFLFDHTVFAQIHHDQYYIAPLSIFSGLSKYFAAVGVNLHKDIQIKLFKAFKDVSDSIFPVLPKREKDVLEALCLKNAIEKILKNIDERYSKFITIIDDSIKYHSEDGNRFFSIEVEIIGNNKKKYSKRIFFYDPMRPPNRLLRSFSKTWTEEDEQTARERGFWIVPADNENILITGDGFVQSKDGKAPLDLQRIRESEREKLKKAEIPEFEQIKTYIEAKIKELRQRIDGMQEDKYNQKPKLEETYATARDALKRLETIYNQGNIYSFRAIVYGKEDYALSYGSENEIGIAEELLSFPMELLAELLFHEAICHVKGHQEARQMQSSLFKENYDNPDNYYHSALKRKIREFIDYEARTMDGVDYFELIRCFLVSDEDVEFIYIEKDNEKDSRGFKSTLVNIVEKKKMCVFTGDVSIYNSFINALYYDNAYFSSNITKGEELVGSIKVAVHKDYGVIGVTGIPDEINYKIKDAVRMQENAQLVNLLPLFVLINLHKLGYKCLDVTIDEYIKTGSLSMSYEDFIKIIENFTAHVALKENLDKEEIELEREIDEGNKELKDKERLKEKKEKGYAMENRIHEEQNLLSRLLNCIKEECIKKHLRRMILEHYGEKMVSEEILGFLIISGERYSGSKNKKIIEYLWEFYLDNHNTSIENEKILKILLEYIGNYKNDVNDAMDKIQSIFLEANLNKCYKAVEALLRLDIDKEIMDNIFYVLKSAPFMRQVLAAFCFANYTLKGPEEKVIDRHYGMYDADPFLSEMCPEMRHVYFYMLRTNEIMERGGTLNQNVNRRAIALTIRLDNNAGAPGMEGHSWFTWLRSRVHTNASSDDLDVVRLLLYHLKDKHLQSINSKHKTLQQEIPEYFSGEELDQYSNILNKTLKYLKTQGHLKSLDKDDFLNEFNSIQESVVCDAIRKASEELLGTVLKDEYKEYFLRQLQQVANYLKSKVESGSVKFARDSFVEEYKKKIMELSNNAEELYSNYSYFTEYRRHLMDLFDDFASFIANGILVKDEDKRYENPGVRAVYDYRDYLIRYYMRHTIPEKLENVISLFYALTERYGSMQANIIPKIKGQFTGSGGDEEGSWAVKRAMEEMKEATEFMRKQYDELVKVIESKDSQVVIKHIAECSMLIRNQFLYGKFAEDEDDMLGRGGTFQKRKVMELNHNLYLLGKEHVIRLMKEIVECETLEDLRRYIDAMASIAKFILSSGLGGVEYEQLVNELENDNLTFSQVHDLVRALRTEVHKITRNINESMRFATGHIWDHLYYYKLTDGWQKAAKTKKVETEYGYEETVITEEGMEQIIAEIVDTLIRDTQILSFDQMLARFNEICETELTPLNDAVAVERYPATSEIDLNSQFFRFGQPEVIPRDKLLSLWSKKGLNLVEMTEKDIKVPPGVILSSRLVTRPDIFKSSEFRQEVEREVALIRKYSKYPDLKFLLYARSGSAFTLPGLLMTIPNLGMNDKEAEDLAQKTGDLWFAYDTYAEFIRSYAINILGIPEEYFHDILNVYKKDELSGEEMKDVVERYKKVVVEKYDIKLSFNEIIPEDMIEQVMLAIDAVYASWDSQDARSYREKHRISQDWGTVVILQKGIFGNLDVTSDGRISGTGFGILRTLPDGREVVQGKFRFRAFGDQLMSRADQNYVLLSNSQRCENEQTLEDLQPEIYEQILKRGHELKNIFGNNQQFEFVIELNDLWITQSNDDYVTDDYPEFVNPEEYEDIGRGHGVSAGAFRGWVANSLEKAKELMDRYNAEKPDNVDGVILFLNRVNPELINLIPKGVAICAKIISVHAETLAQKGGIPSVYGVSGMEYNEKENIWYINGRKMEDGMIISMDGHENQLVYHNSGKIFLGSIPIGKTSFGKSEIERRSPRALDRIRELREQELVDEATAGKDISLTNFEKEILVAFQKFMTGELQKSTIDRYTVSYGTILDKIAVFCKDLDFNLYGEEFKSVLIERLTALGISFEIYFALHKNYYPRGKKSKEILMRIDSRLSFKPPEKTGPDKIIIYSADGKEAEVDVTDISNIKLPFSCNVFIVNPLKQQMKLVSFELDDVIEQLLHEGFDNFLELLRRIKAMGCKIAITSQNPEVLRWYNDVCGFCPELKRLVDFCEYDRDYINLQRYVERLGIDKEEIIHYGNWLYSDLTGGSSVVADLHRQGFKSVMIANRGYIPHHSEIINKEIDAVIFGRLTAKNIIDILESYKWGKDKGNDEDNGGFIEDETVKEDNSLKGIVKYLNSREGRIIRKEVQEERKEPVRQLMEAIRKKKPDIVFSEPEELERIETVFLSSVVSALFTVLPKEIVMSAFIGNRTNFARAVYQLLFSVEDNDYLTFDENNIIANFKKIPQDLLIDIFKENYALFICRVLLHLSFDKEIFNEQMAGMLLGEMWTSYKSKAPEGWVDSFGIERRIGILNGDVVELSLVKDEGSSDDSGALKDIGPAIANEMRWGVIHERETAWRKLLETVDPTKYEKEVVLPNGKHVKLSAYILPVTDMPEGIDAWRFTKKEHDFTGKHIIAVRVEDIERPYFDEIMFHEIREGRNYERLFDSDKKHILASAETVIAFSQNGGLTGYHKAQLEKMTPKRVEWLINEYETGRRQNKYALIGEHLGEDVSIEAMNYERMMYTELIKKRGRPNRDVLENTLKELSNRGMAYYAALPNTGPSRMLYFEWEKTLSALTARERKILFRILKEKGFVINIVSRKELHNEISDILRKENTLSFVQGIAESISSSEKIILFDSAINNTSVIHGNIIRIGVLGKGWQCISNLLGQNESEFCPADYYLTSLHHYSAVLNMLDVVNGFSNTRKEAAVRTDEDNDLRVLAKGEEIDIFGDYGDQKTLNPENFISWLTGIQGLTTMHKLIGDGVKINIAKRPLNEILEISDEKDEIYVDPEFIKLCTGDNPIYSSGEAVFLLNLYFTMLYTVNFYKWGKGRQYSDDIKTALFAGYYAGLFLAGENKDRFKKMIGKMQRQYGMLDGYFKILMKYDLKDFIFTPEFNAGETGDIDHFIEQCIKDHSEFARQNANSEFFSVGHLRCMVVLSKIFLYNSKPQKVIADLIHRNPEHLYVLNIIKDYRRDLIDPHIVTELFWCTQRCVKKDINSDAERILSDVFYENKEKEKLVTKELLLAVLSLMDVLEFQRDPEAILKFASMVISTNPDLINREIIDCLWQKTGCVKVSAHGDVLYEGQPEEGQTLESFYKSIEEIKTDGVWTSFRFANEIMGIMMNIIDVRPNLFNENDLKQIIYINSNMEKFGIRRDDRGDSRNVFYRFCHKCGNLINTSVINGLIDQLMVKRSEEDDTFSLDSDVIYALRAIVKCYPDYMTKDGFINLLQIFNSNVYYEKENGFGDLLCEIIEECKFKISEDMTDLLLGKAKAKYTYGRDKIAAVAFEKILKKLDKDAIKRVARRLVNTAVYSVIKNDELGIDYNEYPIYKGMALQAAIGYLDIMSKHDRGVYSKGNIMLLAKVYRKLSRSKRKAAKWESDNVLRFINNACEKDKKNIPRELLNILARRLELDKEMKLDDESRICFHIFEQYFKGSMSYIPKGLLKRLFKIYQNMKTGLGGVYKHDVAEMIKNIMRYYSDLEERQRHKIANWFFKAYADLIIDTKEDDPDGIHLTITVIENLYKHGEKPGRTLMSKIPIIKERKKDNKRKDCTAYRSLYNLILNKGFIPFTKEDCDEVFSTLFSIEGGDRSYFGYFEPYEKFAGFDIRYAKETLQKRICDTTRPCSMAIIYAYCGLIDRKKIFPSVEEFIQYINLAIKDDSQPKSHFEDEVRFGALIKMIGEEYPDFISNSEALKALRVLFTTEKGKATKTYLSLMNEFIKRSSKLVNADLVRFILKIMFMDDTEQDGGSGMYWGGMKIRDITGIAMECMGSMTKNGYNPKAYPTDVFETVLSHFDNPKTTAIALRIFYVFAEIFAHYIDEKIFLKFLAKAESCGEDRDGQKESILNMMRKILKLNEAVMSSAVEEKLSSLMHGTDHELREFAIGAYTDIVENGQKAFQGKNVSNVLRNLKKERSNRGNFVKLLQIVFRSNPDIMNKEYFEVLLEDIPGYRCDRNEMVFELFNNTISRKYEWMDASYIQAVFDRFLKDLLKERDSGRRKSRFSEWDEDYGRDEPRARTLMAVRELVKYNKGAISEEQYAELKKIIISVLNGTNGPMIAGVLRLIVVLCDVYPDLIDFEIEDGVARHIDSKYEDIIVNAVDTYRAIYQKRPELITSNGLDKISEILFFKASGDMDRDFGLEGRITAFFKFVKVCPNILNEKAYMKIIDLFENLRASRFIFADRDTYLFLKNLKELIEKGVIKARQEILEGALKFTETGESDELIGVILKLCPEFITKELIDSAAKPVLSETEKVKDAVFSSEVLRLTEVLKSASTKAKYNVLSRLETNLKSGNRIVRINAMAGISALIRNYNLALSPESCEYARKAIESGYSDEKTAGAGLLSLLYHRKAIKPDVGAKNVFILSVGDEDNELRKQAIWGLSACKEVLDSNDFEILSNLLIREENTASSENPFTNTYRESLLQTMFQIMGNEKIDITQKAFENIKCFMLQKKYILGEWSFSGIIDLCIKILKRDTADITADDVSKIVQRIKWWDERMWFKIFHEDKVMELIDVIIENRPDLYQELLLSAGAEGIPYMTGRDKYQLSILGLMAALGKDVRLVKDIINYYAKDGIDSSKLKAIMYFVRALKDSGTESAFNRLYELPLSEPAEIIEQIGLMHIYGITDVPKALPCLLNLAEKKGYKLTDVAGLLTRINEQLKKHGFANWIFYHEMLEEMEDSELVQEWDIIIAILEHGIFPSKALLSRLAFTDNPMQEINSWKDILNGIDDGDIDFNGHIPLHVELGYTYYRRLLDFAAKRTDAYNYNSYKDFILDKEKLGFFESDTLTLSDEDRAELRYASYESFQLVQYVKKIKEKTRQPVMVVANMSYGGFIVDPVRSRLEDLGVKLITARIGSSECHDNPFYIKPDLFDMQNLQWIIENKPVIVVVDGTVNIESKKLDTTTRDTYGGRYPDSYQGYRNYLIALSDVITNGNAHLIADKLGVDELFVEKMRKEPEYMRLIALMRSLRIRDEASEGYMFKFWNPADIPLGIREYRTVVNTANSSQAEDITGHSLVIANSVIPDESVPDELRKLCEGVVHEPAYYDDKSHIQRFKFKITKRGLQLDMRISEYIRDTYNRFEQDFGQWQLREVLMAESGDSKTKIDAGAKARLDKALAKKYKAVVFDFDNTIASNSSADGSILRKIVELLRRGIHVGIVSGKGGALKKLLIDRLGFMLGADKDALKYFHVYVHNGASGYNAFTNEKYYNSEFAYSDLYKMGRLIAEKFKYADQIGHFEIGEEIMYTKLVPSANIDQTTITLALNLFFKAEDLPFVAVTSKLTIDITSRESDKGRAVRDLSERFGIPIDEIVKLGDQGQKGGNDHSMLIGEGAFSVDEYDQDTKQVPVKSAIGLKCVNAAKWLFENIKFEPKDSAADKKLPAIDELLDKLETSVRQEKDIEAEITNAGSYAQRVRNTKRLQLAIPADVLKDTADIGIALKKMRMLGNGETIFELIIYGLDNEIDGDKFIQLLKLPSNVRVYSVTKDEIYPEMEISSIKSIINKKYPVSSDDKLLILKDAASNEEAERIKKEIGLMPEEEKNTRIGIVVKPIDNISGISLSKILSEMLSDFGKYEHKAIKIILPVVLSSAEVKKQIEQDISALWNLLQSA